MTDLALLVLASTHLDLNAGVPERVWLGLGVHTSIRVCNSPIQEVQVAVHEHGGQRYYWEAQRADADAAAGDVIHVEPGLKR